MPINEAEKKLAAYRARKEREEFINHYKAEVKNMFSNFIKKKDHKNEEIESEKDSTENLLSSSMVDNKSDADSIDDYHLDIEEENSSLTVFDYVQYCLWFILWVTMYAIFIKLQFGIIYLIFSAIIGMYLNTRTGPKKKHEISAYSVFNKNCKSIDGTLDADKMTQQMLYGGFSR